MGSPYLPQTSLRSRSKLLSLFREEQDALQSKEYVDLYHESLEIQRKLTNIEARYEEAYQAITELENLATNFHKPGSLS